MTTREAAVLRLPALTLEPEGLVWRTPLGLEEPLGAERAARQAQEAPPLVCHLPSLCRRLGIGPFPALDLLELFAFARPAAHAVPTPEGLRRALDLPAAETPRETLQQVAAELIATADRTNGRQARAIAFQLAKDGWPWGPFLLRALGLEDAAAPPARGLAIWEHLPRWEDPGPPPPSGQQPVDAAETRARLDRLRGAGAEDRPQQADYATAVTQAFAAPEEEGAPHVVLVEAGTGVGKTLGYLAPVSLWSERNKGTVYLSTFTRALQRQLDQELDRLFPDPDEKAERVVIRKGRENYLCLLNYSDAVGGLQLRPGDLLAVALMARWALVSRDGDMVGGDFPGWLPDLVGRARTLGLTDRRGECIYAACEHYGRCFIERSQRKARRARLVVANHALLLAQAAGALDDAYSPLRIVFDEGHHLFDAADSAFALHLSGREGQELSRWLVGGEGGRGANRLRGLKRRLEDLVLDDAEAMQHLQASLQAAAALPSGGWSQRLRNGMPQGPAEVFLAAVAQQVEARAAKADALYDLECDTQPATETVLEAGRRLQIALEELAEPLRKLAGRLQGLLDGEPELLDADQRRRLEASVRMLNRRALWRVQGWLAMLEALEEGTPDDQIDWMAIERRDGQAIDVSLNRHAVDPMKPFTEIVLKPAHGVAITSATLAGTSGLAEPDWQTAALLTGARHLPAPAIRARVPSPFDYPNQARVIVLTDVDRRRAEAQAAALAGLFTASGGGAIGLFTAIQRLRQVHRLLFPRLAESGLQLYAQHIDLLDTGTLVDIFRLEEQACLLGTDALRDGIDIPGPSLRLLAYDRVPWPRPDIRHRVRREHFGGRSYDEEIVRRRLRQAFGRLIRRADDRGILAILDSALPTRFLSAFPEGVPVERLPLAEACSAIRRFLGDYKPSSR